jgi:hypothetical protein
VMDAEQRRIRESYRDAGTHLATNGTFVA